MVKRGEVQPFSPPKISAREYLFYIILQIAWIQSNFLYLRAKKDLVRFLIIRFSSIGDIVLTTPVVRCLKEQIEDAEVHYLTKKSHASIVASNPYVDKVHVLDNNMPPLLKALKKESFDYIIDLHRNLRSARVKQSLRRLSFSFDKINWQKWLMVNFKIYKLTDKHIVDRYLETTALFDVKNDGKGLDYFIPRADHIELNQLPSLFSDGYIGFAIGAQHHTKKLPPEKIAALCRKIDLPVLLLGGKEDVETAKRINEAVGDNVYNACGKYNLHQSASLVEQARCVISHDTGLMHIAAAFGKKIISIWGNTIPGFGMYPYRSHPASFMAQVQGLPCRPCSKIGHARCPKDHFRCMTWQDEDIIAGKARELFGK